MDKKDLGKNMAMESMQSTAEIMKKKQSFISMKDSSKITTNMDLDVKWTREQYIWDFLSTINSSAKESQFCSFPMEIYTLEEY